MSKKLNTQSLQQNSIQNYLKSKTTALGEGPISSFILDQTKITTPTGSIWSKVNHKHYIKLLKDFVNATQIVRDSVLEVEGMEGLDKLYKQLKKHNLEVIFEVINCTYTF